MITFRILGPCIRFNGGRTTRRSLGRQSKYERHGLAHVMIEAARLFETVKEGCVFVFLIKSVFGRGNKLLT